MRNLNKLDKINFLFLIIILSSTTFLSLKTLKKVYIHDVEIKGSKLIKSQQILENSTLSFPIRLIFIKTESIEKDLKQNLSLQNIAIFRQIFPFGLKILIKTRTPVAHGEKTLNDKKITGFIDKDGFFINKKYAEEVFLEKSALKVYGWQENFRKTISEILGLQKNYELDLVKVIFSPNGFLTLEEKDLKTIYLGFNSKLIQSQLQMISNIKDQLKKNHLNHEIHNIDLTDPSNPKIKVFKP